MASNDDYFEVDTSRNLRGKYGLYAENRPEIQLDSFKESEKFRHLIPLAEKFGVGDDIIRGEIMRQAPASEIAELRKFMADYAEALDE